MVKFLSHGWGMEGTYKSSVKADVGKQKEDGSLHNQIAEVKKSNRNLLTLLVSTSKAGNRENKYWFGQVKCTIQD